MSSMPRWRTASVEAGSVPVEYAGLIALLALALAAAFAALSAHGPLSGGRETGGMIARRIICAPNLPDYCRRDRLVPPYGEPLARLVRSMAPDPLSLPRQGLVPVDFRRCRRESCAIPVSGPRADRLTESNRRIVAFTEVRDNRRSNGTVEVTYWLYRPGRPWERLTRIATREDIAMAASTRLGLDDTPRLVPLETLAGRNHIPFRAISEPPWRWQVTPVYPGRVP